MSLAETSRKEFSMKNGTCWLDTDSNQIQAHGGCILNYKDVYYWYGENKDTDTMEDGFAPFMGMSCYSSADLLNWKNEGIVLKPILTGNHELGSDGIGERPKVIYNKKNNEFVMLFHLDNKSYRYARIGTAVAKTPTGPFEYRGNLWLDSECSPCGRDSRDMYVYQEEDGTAYIIASSDFNSSTVICKLDDSYTGLTGEMKTIFVEQYREAQVLIKEKGRYYMFSSGCTGWLPNSMLYGISRQVMGTWRLVDNPCSGANYRQTFFGQSANAFQLKEQWYLMLDHWKPEDLRSSGYSFLPIRIDAEYVEIPWTEEFNGERGNHGL